MLYREGEVVLLNQRRHWTALFSPFHAILLLMIITIPVWMLLYAHWLSERLIVTDRRLIQVKGLVSRRILETERSQIIEAKLYQNPLGKLLNYGSFIVIAGGTFGTGLLHYVRNPQRVQILIRPKE